MEQLRCFGSKSQALKLPGVYVGEQNMTLGWPAAAHVCSFGFCDRGFRRNLFLTKITFLAKFNVQIGYDTFRFEKNGKN